MLDLRTDGTIHTKIGDTAYVLRAPTLDELFALWASIEENADNGQAKPAEEEGSVASHLRTLQQNARWMSRVFETLADQPVSEPARPAWFASATVAAQMLRHWQEVPLVPGSGP